jgi:D-alanyl-D-alanine carboxypeptidase (penicillin-binding protein 5/6)
VSHFFRLKRVLLLLVIAATSTWSSASVLKIDPLSVEAAAWLIYDPQSQQIIDQYQSDVARAPASLTKMMVAYLSLKAIRQGQLHLEQQVQVPAIVSSVHGDESRLRLKANQQISVQDLLSGLIIMSANDAALTLASVVSKDVPHFVALMNQTAQQLGMRHSHFANPSGISMPDHYSTAHDMALLAQAILKQTPEYLHYSEQPQFSYHGLTHHATNLLLKKDASVDGMKTGYTAEAGYNLVLTANRLDQQRNEYRRLIVVVLGTASAAKRAEVADRLLNVAFNYTQNLRWSLAAQTVADIPVHNGQRPSYRLKLAASTHCNSLSLLAQDQVLNLQHFDLRSQRFSTADGGLLLPLTQPQQLRYQVALAQSTLQAPLHQAMPLAQIQLQQYGQVVDYIELKPRLDLAQSSWWHRAWHWLQVQLGLVDQHVSPKLYPLHFV